MGSTELKPEYTFLSSRFSLLCCLFHLWPIFLCPSVEIMLFFCYQRYKVDRVEQSEFSDQAKVRSGSSVSICSPDGYVLFRVVATTHHNHMNMPSKFSSL